MITKLINRLIITTIFCSINLIAYGGMADLKGEYYEKDGCIYLFGNLTEEEKQADLENYKQRIAERTEQIDAEIQRNHDIKLAKIKAQAMRDYLIAQGIPLREVADAFRKLKIGQNVVIGNITSASEGGDVSTTNSNTNTSKNTNETEIDVDIEK